MRVLFVTHTTCARAFKEAMALMRAGVPVHILQMKVANDAFVTAMGPCQFYSDRDNLAKKVAPFKDWDLVHIHNEPDWMIQSVRAGLPDIPIVYDCHDLESQRNGEATADERKAFELADAFIFPSKAYQNGAMGYHGCEKPSEVVYTWANAGDIRHHALPRVQGGIVYEGGAVAAIEGYDESRPNWYGYRDYWHTANYLSRCGIPFAMIGVRQDFQNAYLQSGALILPYMDYPHMISQLTRFDWGFLGHPETHPQWKKAMPNKLFEYMAAGLPSIVLNADECAEFVSKHKVGVVVDRLSDIPKLYRDDGYIKLHSELRENVLKVREQFVMDNQVDKIKDLYAKVVK